MFCIPYMKSLRIYIHYVLSSQVGPHRMSHSWRCGDGTVCPLVTRRGKVIMVRGTCPFEVRHSRMLKEQGGRGEKSVFQGRLPRTLKPKGCSTFPRTVVDSRITARSGQCVYQFTLMLWLFRSFWFRFSGSTWRKVQETESSFK